MKHITTFQASIPPIMSAFKVGGDGCRISFDIPESDKIECLKLLTVQNMVLTVTVSVGEENPPLRNPINTSKSQAMPTW